MDAAATQAMREVAEAIRTLAEQQRQNGIRLARIEEALRPDPESPVAVALDAIAARIAALEAAQTAFIPLVREAIARRQG